MTLLAQWKLDETSGTTVYDSVGSNNGTSATGNVVGVGAGNGPGGSLADAGLDFYLDYLDFGTVGFGGDYTVSAWLKKDDALALTKIAIDARDSSSDGFVLFADSTPRWSHRHDAVKTSNGDSPVADQWVHLAATHNGTVTKLFIDGVLVDTQAAAFDISVSAGFRIGARAAALGADFYWDGKISDVRVYDSDESTNITTILDDARPTCSVSITGTPTVGETYTATPLTNDSTATFTYQWYRADNASGLNEAAISGATSSTYTTQAADETKFIRCRSDALNTGGAGLKSAFVYSSYSAEITSGATPVTVAPSAITATSTVDSPSVSIGSVSPVTVAPSAITATSTVDSPSVSIGSVSPVTVAPSAITATSTVTAPTVSLGAASPVTVVPEAISTTSAVDAPAVTIGSVSPVSAAPSAITATSTVDPPSVSIGAASPVTVVPEAISTTSAVSSPTVTIPQPGAVAPGAIELTSVVSAPTVTIGAVSPVSVSVDPISVAAAVASSPSASVGSVSPVTVVVSSVTLSLIVADPTAFSGERVYSGERLVMFPVRSRGVVFPTRDRVDVFRGD